MLVAFICTHCPYVKHVKREFASFARDYRAKGLAIVGIASNDATTHPDDSPVGMANDAREQGYEFPYLYRRITGCGESLQGRLHAGLVSLRS